MAWVPQQKKERWSQFGSDLSQNGFISLHTHPNDNAHPVPAKHDAYIYIYIHIYIYTYSKHNHYGIGGMGTKMGADVFFDFQPGALFLAICYILEQKPVLCWILELKCAILHCPSIFPWFSPVFPWCSWIYPKFSSIFHTFRWAFHGFNWFFHGFDRFFHA